MVKVIGEISRRDREISRNLYKWLEKNDFTELENFYENFKGKENVSQRRKDQMRMLFNQYEKIRARVLYHTFFANYGKNREKAYELCPLFFS